jgi:hypothetical protein
VVDEWIGEHEQQPLAIQVLLEAFVEYVDLVTEVS